MEHIFTIRNKKVKLLGNNEETMKPFENLIPR